MNENLTKYLVFLLNDTINLYLSKCRPDVSKEEIIEQLADLVIDQLDYQISPRKMSPEDLEAIRKQLFGEDYDLEV